MSFPCIEINLNRIAHNARIINDRCIHSGISVVGVTKSVLADINIAKVLKKSGITAFGDSRLQNLIKLKNYFGYGQKLMMLRTPMLSECESLIEVCSISMQTEPAVIKKISETCKRKNLKHSIIVMVETDDRREGISPKEAIEFIGEVLNNYKNINVMGLGTNARCISRKNPSLESIESLISIKNKIKKIYNFDLKVISGGNSSLWHYIQSGSLPKEVNEVRIGEAIFTGKETTVYSPIEGAFNDCFLLKSEIIEAKIKNRLPYKAITALGVQDVSFKNLKIKNSFYDICAQSSDHMVLKLKKNPDLSSSKYILKTGSIVEFEPDYFGILACMTSPFVEKIYTGT